MKIVVNTTIIMSGGGLQVSLSFIRELQNFRQNEYFIFLSPAVAEALNTEGFSDNFRFVVIDKSPARLQYRRSVTRKLDSLVADFQPDIVFSVFGPTYWRPAAPHIMGFAIPYILYDEYRFVRQLGLRSRLEFQYKKNHTVANADYYITETADASSRLSVKTGINPKYIFTVSNTYSNYYNKNISGGSNRFSDRFTLVNISNGSAHKNLSILPALIEVLKSRKLDLLFVLTLDSETYKKITNIPSPNILNLGPVAPSECPEIYSASDALFMPSLLEVFSASYPEAMKMQLPILTSDLGFARSVCEDAALYFNPYEINNIADKIQQLVEDKSLQTDLIKAGKRVVGRLPSPQGRANEYLSICEHVKAEVSS